MVYGFNEILICAIGISEYATAQIPPSGQHHDPYFRILSSISGCYGIAIFSWKIEIQQKYMCGFGCKLSIQLFPVIYCSNF